MSDEKPLNAKGARHGGAILVDALVAQGGSRVFCVPGESYLAVLDALYDADIHTVTARQEGGATMMAEAHGKLTGRPGIAMVTRGPGATNAASGVHVAFQDSTPMILFIGQVASDQRDREAFQEVDYRAMYGPLAKWVAQIDRADRIPEYVARAFRTALSGRPGPVVLALPEDMLSASHDDPPAPLPRVEAAIQKPDAESIRRIVDAAASAKNPFLLVGGGGWTAEARSAAALFAQMMHMPVGTSFRCQDYVDNRHLNYAGDVGIGPNPALAERVKRADLLLVVGPRLGEMTTSGYTLPQPPDPAQMLIHVHPDPNELGRVYRPTVALAASPAATMVALAEKARAPSSDRSADVAACRAAYESWQEPQETPGLVKMEQVIGHLSAVLPEGAILTNGAGNYAAWLHRYHRYRGWRTQLAPTSGSMGYGLPAAVAAKLERPDTPVICLAGDGCFQMTMQEFGTAADQGAAIIVLVANNGHLGTIRMHQHRTYPGRPSATALQNPDFAALARSYGGYGATVERQDAFAGLFAEALACGKPALLDLKLDPRALSPRMVLDA